MAGKYEVWIRCASIKEREELAARLRAEGYTVTLITKPQPMPVERDEQQRATAR
jgi:hypothetical protein